MLLKIELDRTDAAYFVGETITGSIILLSDSILKYKQIDLTVRGVLLSDARLRNVYQPLYTQITTIRGAGKVDRNERTEVRFSIPLEEKQGHTLLESFEGLHIRISYSLTVEVRGSLFQKSMQQHTVLSVLSPGQGYKADKPQPIPFTINTTTNDTVAVPVQTKYHRIFQKEIPKIRLHGHLGSSAFNVEEYVSGEIVLDEVDERNPVTSIDVTLIRVEQYIVGNSELSSRSDVQSIQVVEGCPCNGLPLPLWSVLPRLFICPNVFHKGLKVHFEVNIVIAFQDNQVITEKFPIRVYREPYIIHKCDSPTLGRRQSCQQHHTLTSSISSAPLCDGECEAPEDDDELFLLLPIQKATTAQHNDNTQIQLVSADLTTATQSPQSAHSDDCGVTRPITPTPHVSISTHSQSMIMPGLKVPKKYQRATPSPPPPETSLFLASSSPPTDTTTTTTLQYTTTHTPDPNSALHNALQMHERSKQSTKSNKRCTNALKTVTFNPTVEAYSPPKRLLKRKKKRSKQNKENIEGLQEQQAQALKLMIGPTLVGGTLPIADLTNMLVAGRTMPVPCQPHMV